MKCAYPIILTPEMEGFSVYIPDFPANTQGETLTHAIEMARDAIGLLGITLADEGRDIPQPSALTELKHSPVEMATLVDVDFTEYRRQNDMRSVRRNCTLPAWLDAEASKAHINVSAVLQNALKQELNRNNLAGG